MNLTELRELWLALTNLRFAGAARVAAFMRQSKKYIYLGDKYDAWIHCITDGLHPNGLRRRGWRTRKMHEQFAGMSNLE